MTSDLTARLTLSTADQRARIDPMIYGQYFEHLEDCIYPGVLRNDELRGDVIEASRELGVPVVRWPGGCFADLYHWEDGVGPREVRPVRRNWHWGGTESNRFGTDEFARWVERVGAHAYINVNLGTGTLDEALRWLDYCNGTEDSADVLARRANGRHEPWNVRYWGIGNETWGAWEAGHSDALHYAQTLANWADFFKRYDPELQIIAVGSQAANDPDWDRTVLETAGEHLDFVSLHVYGSSTVGNECCELHAIASTPAYLERRIDILATRVREYNAACARRSPVRIAIDEWNIRHYRQVEPECFELERASERNYGDVLFAAGMFHAMIRNSDVVAMANYVFLVNGNGVLDARGDTVVPSALFGVFQYYRKHFSAHATSVRVDGPTISMPTVLTDFPGSVPDSESVPSKIAALDIVACTGDDGQQCLAIINRHPTASVALSIDGVDAVGDCVIERIVTTAGGVEIVGVPSTGDSELTLPPLSLTFLRRLRED